MTGPLFLSASGVAAAVGLGDATAFLRRRARLENEDLFPLPLRSSLRPMLWRADEVRAWVDRNGRPGAVNIPIEAIASGKIVLLDMARSA